MSDSILMGDIVKERREQLGLTQVDLGRALGIASGEFLCMVEAGRRHFALENVPRLAAVLCLDAAGLCRCALREVAPQFYHSVFGDAIPPRPQPLIKP
jgi:transcriptional regulator with XRE-family HTH domain